MSTRLPMGVSQVENHRPDKARTGDMAGKDGQALKGNNDEKAVVMQREIDKLRSKLARRDATISSLQSIPRGGLPNSHAEPTPELQTRLNDLIARYQESKTAHREEISGLRKENEVLQTSLQRMKTQVPDEQVTKSNTTITNLRAKLALAETENATLKKDLAEKVFKSNGPTIEEKLAMRKEKAGLESECRKLKEGLSKIEGELGMVRCENERLRWAGAMAAERCGNLVALLDIVERAREEEHIEAKEEVESLRSELSVTRRELSCAKRTIEELKEQLDMTRVEIEDQAGRPDTLIIPTLPVENRTVEPLHSTTEDHNESSAVLDLCLTHCDLATSHLIDQLDLLSFAHNDLISTHETTSQALAEVSSELGTVREEMRTAQFDNEALRVAHAPCSGRIADLEKDLDAANQVMDARGQEVQEVRDEVKVLEGEVERLMVDLREANEHLQRGRFAQESLEEEIDHLQRCLDTSSDFEAKYLDLLERQTILETREAMAIEEVEKLELQHAELLGHASRGTGGASGNGKAGPSGSANGHGMQRINYIESVRREMAMVRAELASTRTHLNTANDRVRSLEAEIDAYKSIDFDRPPPSNVGLGSSHKDGPGLGASRTRVVRREQEGGRVIGRSVSTSTRR